MTSGGVRKSASARNQERGFGVAAALGGAGSLGAIGIGAVILLKPLPASAVPSFARQTGQPCATCHTAFPELTPFGRRFKINGYTLGGGLTFEEAPPLAAMVIPTFSHTARNQDAPPVPDSHTNDNLILQQASLFYGGQIYGNLGAFIQGTYDRASNRVFLDNTDIRYADTAHIFGLDVIYGVTANNNPTVQDPWNTTPAWGFPYISSSLAPQFSPPGTAVEGAFAGTVAGTGFYTFWNDLLYIEFTAYQNLSKQALELLGEPDPGTTTSISGIAPYGRAALEYDIGEHSFEVGTFALYTSQVPGRIAGFGLDQVLDIGFDAQYQYIGDPHIITARITHINETQQLNASFLQLGVLGTGSTNLYNTLETFKASISYIYDHTYSLTAGYFSTYGTADAGLFAGSSVRNSPDGQGLIFDAAYLPFSHGGPSFWPWGNARIGLSYTHYLKLFGGVNNFDGAFHNASQNNTLFAYWWMAF